MLKICRAGLTVAAENYRALDLADRRNARRAALARGELGDAPAHR